MNNFPYPIIFPNNCEIAIIREKLKELDKVKENSAAIIMIWDRDTFNAIEKVLK